MDSILFTIAASIGTITVILLLFFSAYAGLANTFLIIFKPTRYIQNAHGEAFDEIIRNQFEGKINTTIESTILKTLEDTGLQKCITKQKSIFLILTKQFVDARIREQYDNYESLLLALIKKNSFKADSRIGKTTISQYNYYINLRRILPNSEDATKISYILAGFIYKHIESSHKTYDFIAVNRNSNAILGYLISNLLDLPLLIVNYDSRWELDGKKINIDGLEGLNKSSSELTGFIVDDAVSGGTIIKESCEILRAKHLNTNDVFVLFSRKEDDAINNFQENSIILHSIFNLDDSDIQLVLDTDEKKLNEIINELT